MLPALADAHAGMQRTGTVIAVEVEELKRRIHNELFGDRFPSTPSITEWKKQRKEEIMRRSVRIMRRNEQSDNAIWRMLQEKFLLTEEEAKQFMKKESKA